MEICFKIRVNPGLFLFILVLISLQFEYKYNLAYIMYLGFEPWTADEKGTYRSTDLWWPPNKIVFIGSFCLNFRPICSTTCLSRLPTTATKSFQSRFEVFYPTNDFLGRPKNAKHLIPSRNGERHFLQPPAANNNLIKVKPVLS